MPENGIKLLVRYSYIGTNYHGSAYQENVSTVESHLINAFIKSKLIAEVDNCDYSKCSRTDKGVHARANYISFVPSSQAPQLHLMNVNRVNKYLPDDICITKIFQVGISFSSRFDCVARIYKYFFNSAGLDVEKMKEASQIFIGEHDFKLFSKRNRGVVKPTIKVTEFMIEPFGEGFHVATIKAKSFLWHQVRCMMGALIMLGSSRITLEKLKNMLHLKEDNKNYVMAPADGLVLYDCLFDNIEPMTEDVQYFKPYCNRINLLNSVVNFITNEVKNVETETN